VALLEDWAQSQGRDIAESLASELGCESVAEALTTALTTDATVTIIDAYEGCDRGCTLDVCTDAVSALWQRAEESTPVASTIALAAAGIAELSGDTNVVAFSGDWLGTAVIRSDADAPIRGTFVASEAPQ
jgi:hypothetical protein